MTAPSINKSSGQKSTGIYTFSLSTLHKEVVRRDQVLPHTRAVFCNVDKLMLKRVKEYIYYTAATAEVTGKGTRDRGLQQCVP